jgi:hypothetical protein
MNERHSFAVVKTICVLNRRLGEADWPATSHVISLPKPATKEKTMVTNTKYSVS